MAEVILTLDNHDGWLPIDFEEVTIARRAYRSGDPEYLINGSRARLRDVVELLAGGRLGANELWSSARGRSMRRSLRRRTAPAVRGGGRREVASGPTQQASSRLARPGELTRVSDLVRELKPQVRRLALQAEHQEAHDRLGRRARALVLEHHARRAQASQSNLGEARRRSAAIAAELEAERGTQSAGQLAVAEAEEQYWAMEQAAREAASAWEAAREAAIRAESPRRARRTGSRSRSRSRTNATSVDRARRVVGWGRCRFAVRGRRRSQRSSGGGRHRDRRRGSVSRGGRSIPGRSAGFLPPKKPCHRSDARGGSAGRCRSLG